MKKHLYLIALLTTALAVKAQVPTFTKDINTQFLSSSPANIYVHNNVAYFSATVENTGIELWKTDGTPGGTMLVKDIRPGTANSSPSRFMGVGSLVFFTASDGINGTELWVTDGTEAGTKMVKDINTGPASSGPNFMTEVNGKLFFAATDTTYGTELWVSDGTEAGTHLVKNIAPTKTTPFVFAGNFISYNGMLFFAAFDNINGTELWKSDGTDAGTQMVANIGPGNKNGINNAYPVVFNNLLYFVANDSATGYELWRSDGTDTGTKLVKDIYAGTLNSTPTDLVVSGNFIYFVAASPSEGRELWKSDGTTVGTVLVEDLDAGTSSGQIQNLTAVNGKVFFTADIDYGRELYVSDGTVAGTKLTRDLYPIQTDGLVSNLTAVGNTLFFTAHSSPDYQDVELYKSDGSSFGTTRVKNIAAGQTASNPSFLANLNGQLIFQANDRIYGSELWISDGTGNGTVLLKDVWEGTAGSGITSMAAYAGGVMFNANDQVNGDEPWRSNGDSAGTNLVTNIRSGSTSSNPKQFTSAGGKVFFSATESSGFSNADIYYSDGTSFGTGSINTGGNYVTYSNITYFKSALFYSRDGAADGELYTYSFGGSPYRLKLFNPAQLGDYTDNYTVVGNYMYFTADDGPYVGSVGEELYRTDGTSQGTKLIKDIFTGDGKDASPGNLTALDTIVFFSATDGTSGFELWKTDGTSTGTVMVKNINPGSASSGIRNMVAGNGVVYFVANDGTNGTELWKSDGTGAGTVMVKDFTGSEGSTIAQLIFINNTLFFVMNDGINGAELWKSDGTDAGTVLLKDIYPGGTGSNIRNMIKVRNLLFFSADDSVHGQELWKTDGTASGTVMLPEVYTGISSSDPNLLTLFGDTLFFTANHPSYGNELWFLYTNCLYAGLTAGTGCVGSNIEFKDASVDYGRTITEQWWEFGTGDTAVGDSVNYAYATAGTYTITHRIRSNDGCEHTNTRVVTVVAQPVAGFDVAPEEQCLTGNSFALQNTSTPSAGATYQWKFSDNSTSTVRSPTKSFTTAGPKTVKLIVSVTGGCKDSVTKTLTVLPSPATSNITGKNSTSSRVDTFSVVNNPTSTYSWTVTNGIIESGANTNKIIVRWTTMPGTGSVKVTETNDQGCQGNLVAKNVILLQPVFVKDIKANGIISVYPNPATNRISLELEGLAEGSYAASVIDMLGAVVLSQPVTAGETAEINTASLAAGVYTIRVGGEGNTFTAKMIIVR